MFYSNFTIKLINDLYAKMQNALCHKGFEIEKSNSIPCSIKILRQGEVINKYEFLANDAGQWYCLRCSGRGAEHEIQTIEKTKICFGKSVLYIDYNSITDSYDIYIGDDTGLTALDRNSKLCVIHAMMHLICFDISFTSIEPDDASVAIVYRLLGYSDGFHNTLAGKMLWNEAYDMDTMSCFRTIASFSYQSKEQVRRMINEIVHETRTKQRKLALPKLYLYCGLNQS